MTTITEYHGDTGEFILYNRDMFCHAGFSTKNLTVEETHKLAAFCDKLYKDGFRAGQRELAGNVEAILARVP